MVRVFPDGTNESQCEEVGKIGFGKDQTEELRTDDEILVKNVDGTRTLGVSRVKVEQVHLNRTEVVEKMYYLVPRTHWLTRNYNEVCLWEKLMLVGSLLTGTRMRTLKDMVQEKGTLQQNLTTFDVN